MFACLYLPLRLPPIHLDAGSPERDPLREVAAAFSPRVEVMSDRLVVCDVSGLGRLLGDAGEIGRGLRRAAADRGLAAHVVIAGTRVAAVLMAHARAGLTIIPPGEESACLAPLSLRVLEVVPDLVLTRITTTRSAAPERTQANGLSVNAAASVVNRDRSSAVSPLLDTLRRWGLKTLGDLAALPPAALSERLGQDGLMWQRLARGEDVLPLVPTVQDAPFEAALDLEWPIEGLEPLSFVMGRLLEPLCGRLVEEDRAAAGLTLTLDLVNRASHVRTLGLPAPVRDPRVLRTLVLLDLDAHPPGAAIDRVTLALDPTPGRPVQYTLLARALPSPERLATLLGRLTVLVGEARCGSPALVDSHRPGAFRMTPFRPSHESRRTAHPDPRRSNPTPRIPCAVRRFRMPLPARVTVAEGRPVAVTVDRRRLPSLADLRATTRPVSHDALPAAHPSLPAARRRGAPELARGGNASDGGRPRPAEWRGGQVRTSAGPWRTSGGWWAAGWDREEWDVALAGGVICRLFVDRHRRAWFIDGVMD